MLSILFAVIFIWLGHRRGMRYWHWFGGYLAMYAALLTCVLVGGDVALRWSLAILVVEFVYLGVFLIWPYLATPEQQQAMAAQAAVNQRADQERTERVAASLDDSLAVKVYVESSQVYELHADRKRLEDAAIASFVKTAGITTLFVAKADFEKASALLGIEPLDASELGGATELPGPA